jgi:alkanesulfonate monooxygenase SsuD/methylene tetrahydromethanopterin reductase-like flavin-dependent oxidoreductase (luciferase family)
MAANGDAGVRRAARFADSWLIGPHSTLAELERQVGLFRAERGTPPAECPAIREALLAPTDEEAIAAARPFLDRKYKATSGGDRATSCLRETPCARIGTSFTATAS